MNLRPVTGLVSVCMLVCVTASAVASGDAPHRKFENPYTSIELMNGGETSGVWHSGLHITMQPGWKTYWRMPGDGGVPPQFDWSASDNLADAKVLMPLPHRFVDENGEGIGYKSEVILPVSIVPEDPARPVKVSADVFYAVCNDICVPVQAKISYTLEPDTVSASDRFLLKLAQARVPETNTGSKVEMTSLKVVKDGSKRAIEIGLNGLSEPDKTDIFLEMKGVAYFRKPELVRSQGAETVWQVAIDDRDKPLSLTGKKLHLTISDGETGLVREGVLQ